jgi:hypothetical protein
MIELLWPLDDPLWLKWLVAVWVTIPFVWLPLLIIVIIICAFRKRPSSKG